MSNFNATNEAPLPYGWVKEFSSQNGCYYYIDTNQPNPSPIWDDPRQNQYLQPQQSVEEFGGYQQQDQRFNPQGSYQQSSIDQQGSFQQSFDGQDGEGEVQERFFTDASQTETTTTQDRGFGKVVVRLGVGYTAGKIAANLYDKAKNSFKGNGPPSSAQIQQQGGKWNGGCPPCPPTQQQSGFGVGGNVGGYAYGGR